MRLKYYYGVDRGVVDREISTLFNLSTKEMIYSKRKKADVYNFVGCIFNKDKALVVFPKHYADQSYIDSLNTSHEESVADIQLLYSVIKKYDESTKTNASAQKYIGPDDRYDADYPFAPFYNVYEYFKRYGLYKEAETRNVIGNSGKVNWKETIRKSQKIVSEDNLLFVPLYVKKKNYKQVFISECMVFVIDHTLETFQSFFSMRRTGQPRSRFDFLNNIDYVIRELRNARNEVFKDVHKKLIRDLINFFEQYRSQNAKGGSVHVKIDYFDLIWQDMVNVYLNRHFVGMKAGGTEIDFDKTASKSIISFKLERYDDIDNSPHGYYIDVDHIASSGNELYIFDSKYYDEIYELNYKQFSYNEILRYKYPAISEIYNALILPGSGPNKTHFELTPSYAGPRKIGRKIIEHYIQPQEIMKDYLL